MLTPHIIPTEQSTGVEAVDEVGSSFTQFKLQKAPWDLRYIVYVIQVCCLFCSQTATVAVAVADYCSVHV